MLKLTSISGIGPAIFDLNMVNKLAGMSSVDEEVSMRFPVSGDTRISVSTKWGFFSSSLRVEVCTVGSIFYLSSFTFDKPQVTRFARLLKGHHTAACQHGIEVVRVIAR